MTSRILATTLIKKSSNNKIMINSIKKQTINPSSDTIKTRIDL
jgi:hypothetical protein